MKVALLSSLLSIMLGFSVTSASVSQEPGCGEAVTESLRLTSDLNCTKDGLTLGADNIIL
ncbi:MAG: hypothetical protein ACE5LX_04665 [Nitrospinota bacterium]